MTGKNSRDQVDRRGEPHEPEAEQELRPPRNPRVAHQPSEQQDEVRQECRDLTSSLATPYQEQNAHEHRPHDEHDRRCDEERVHDRKRSLA
jgi:hypothetical protein